MYSEPVYSEPVYSEPVYSEPVYSEPVYSEPVTPPASPYASDGYADLSGQPRGTIL
ncbi:hypothetical protein Vau01_045420 [Virgisporangium aurantiacum]|uniref:Uncharacterized protein n=1 Tax=Virgisporangium aurantiacum TaxID=175570 RepID=A0A8J4E0P3_9ACTN|nr:hypothetical protein Vau01_045420 [Virgisporangium aurantiacum]